MKRNLPLIVSVVALVVAVLSAAGMVQAGWQQQPNAPSGNGSPTVVSYQEQISVGGTPFTGTGYFKFAVVNAAGDTTYCSNDGTSNSG